MSQLTIVEGLTAYRGFYELATQEVVDGLVTITLALAIGLALAAGVAFGDFVARASRHSGWRAFQERLTVESWPYVVDQRLLRRQAAGRQDHPAFHRET